MKHNRKKSKGYWLGFAVWAVFVMGVNALTYYFVRNDIGKCMVCGEISCGDPATCLPWKGVLVICILAIAAGTLWYDAKTKKAHEDK